MPTCAAISTLRPDGDAVGDLHEVVDLGAGLDARLADRRTIDGRVRAELHIVFDDDGRDLRNLLVRAVAAADEAVAVAADDDAVLQDDAVADRARARGSPRSNGSTQSLPTRGAGPIVTFGKITVRSPMRAPSPMATNGADRHVGAEPCVRRDGRQRVDAGRRAPGGGEQADGPRKRQIRIARAQHRARRRRRVVLEDDGRRARGRQRLLVFRIGEEGDVAGLGILDAGHARDLDLAVAFEPALQPIRQFPQLHGTNATRSLRSAVSAGHCAGERLRVTSLTRLRRIVGPDAVSRIVVGGDALEERRQVSQVQRRGEHAGRVRGARGAASAVPREGQ